MKRALPTWILAAIAVSVVAFLGAQAMTASDTVALAQQEGDETEPKGEGRRGPKHRFGLHGAIRGEMVVPGDTDGTFRTVRIDRGVVERVDGATVVVKEADGTVVEISTADDTRIVRDGNQAAVTDIRAGDHVFAHRVNEGDGFVTRAVRAFSPERWAEMEQRREACKDNPRQCRAERRERRMERADDAAA